MQTMSSIQYILYNIKGNEYVELFYSILVSIGHIPISRQQAQKNLQFSFDHINITNFYTSYNQLELATRYDAAVVHNLKRCVEILAKHLTELQKDQVMWKIEGDVTTDA